MKRLNEGSLPPEQGLYQYVLESRPGGPQYIVQYKALASADAFYNFDT